MSWPAASKAARLGTAKSGVPMKASRCRPGVAPFITKPERRAGSDRLFGFEALRLDKFAQDDVALQRRNMVDEQHTLEVIHLVLDDGGEQALGLERADLVLVIEIAHPDFRRAGHIGIM